jgi:hypothetical protein
MKGEAWAIAFASSLDYAKNALVIDWSYTNERTTL